MVKKKVSIVIPNFNGAKLLEKNLPKVIAAAKNYSPDTEIIVVDDESTDNSIENLKSLIGTFRHSGEESLDFARDKLRDDSRTDPGQARTKGFWTSLSTSSSRPRGQNDGNIKVIVKEKNEGFSSTCNIGVKKAKGEIVVLLNTDIWPEENFLSYLAPHFNNSNIFAVGCLDKSLESSKEIERGRGIGWFKRGFLVHKRGAIDKNNTLWVSGGSSAFNKNKWLALGGFDKIYNPFYWEDIDLSYRAQKRGYIVLFEPKAVVHHSHQEGAIKKQYNSGQIKTIAYRNQFIFVWKNITDGDLLLKHILWLPYHLLKAVLTSDFALIKGFLQAIFKLQQVLIHRWYYYRTTVRGSSGADKEILSQFVNEI